MQRYKAIIAYDGTDFAGFQRQSDKRTVQGELEKTLKRINSGNDVIVHAAGRTDSGVHAQGQVIHFDLEGNRDEEKLRFALDTQTPMDISIYQVQKVAPDFHSRYNKHSKCYQYTIDLNKACNPLMRRYALHYTYDLDLELIQEAAKLLEGKHDFTSFCAAGSSVKDKVRTVSKIEIVYHEVPNMLTMTFYGDGFLYKMIRIMVGTLLAVGNRRLTLTKLEEALNAKNRNLLPPTAAACGLCLLTVEYDA